MADRRGRVQVESAEHYQSSEYLTSRRFFSFGVQVELVRSLEPSSVLEVGPGSRVVNRVLRDVLPTVFSVDFDHRVEPDVCGDVSALPFCDNGVDVVLCCQVLEHLPFERVLVALEEIRRVSSTGAVISVPDVRPFYYVDLVLPKIRWQWRTGVPWARPRRHVFDGQHHWVLGSEGFPPERLRSACRDAGWDVVDERRPLEDSYRHFFVLR